MNNTIVHLRCARNSTAISTMKICNDSECFGDIGTTSGEIYAESEYPLNFNKSGKIRIYCKWTEFINDAASEPEHFNETLFVLENYTLINSGQSLPQLVLSTCKP